MERGDLYVRCFGRLVSSGAAGKHRLDYCACLRNCAERQEAWERNTGLRGGLGSVVQLEVELKSGNCKEN